MIAALLAQKDNPGQLIQDLSNCRKGIDFRKRPLNAADVRQGGVIIEEAVEKRGQ